MVNAIVILILILIAIFAIRGTIKHMKGESHAAVAAEPVRSRKNQAS